MTSYFRIQTADRNVDDLLDPANHTSHHWGNYEDMDRPGVSVCATRDDLARYLAGSGIPFGLGEWVIVELAGEHTDVRGCDAETGELLIRPTAIVAVTPADDEFYELVGEHFDAMEAGR